jgi:hypothetical protein
MPCFFFFCGTTVRGEVVSPRRTPNLEDQVSQTGWPSYTPAHKVPRVPRDHHFPYPLTWAPEGMPCLHINKNQLDI